MIEALLVAGLGFLAFTKWAGKKVEGEERAEKSDEPHEDLENVGGSQQPIYGNLWQGEEGTLLDFSLGRSTTPYQEDKEPSFGHTRGMSFAWNKAPSSKFLFKPYRKPSMVFQELKKKAFAREEQLKKEEKKGEKKPKTFGFPWLQQLFSGIGAPVFSEPIKKDDVHIRAGESIAHPRKVENPASEKAPVRSQSAMMSTMEIAGKGYSTRTMRQKTHMTERAIEIEDSFLSEPDVMGPFAPSYQHFVAGQATIVDKGKKDEETIESH